MRRGIRREVSSTKLMFGWRAVLVARVKRKKMRERAGQARPLRERNRKNRSLRTGSDPSVALLEMSQSRDGAKIEEGCRAKARRYASYIPPQKMALKRSWKVPSVWARCWTRKPNITIFPLPLVKATAAALR